MTSSETPRTGRKFTMPPRGSRPGFKIGRVLQDGTPQFYWNAAQIRPDARELGYRNYSVRLPSDADDETISRLCHEHTARLRAWLGDMEAKTQTVPRALYDGSIVSLCRLYQQHPDSPFHEVKRNTRDSYVDSLKVIEATIGHWIVRRLAPLDIKRAHRTWRAPKIDGDRPRKKRAHSAVTLFRTVLRFGFLLGHKECGQLDDQLKMMKFERGDGRNQVMTFAQAGRIARKALELGKTGVIPADRGLAMAIGVWAQYEMGLRQKDVIGEWGPAVPGTPDAVYSNDEMWTGQLRWDALKGWKLRIETSKTGKVVYHDLTDYPALFNVIDQVPHAERAGAFVKGEHGLPIRERSYRKWFREIARAADIPDDVWLMDSRAGGATEAYEAGVETVVIRDHLTHSTETMTKHYIRPQGPTRTNQVAEARNRKRASEAEE